MKEIPQKETSIVSGGIRPVDDEAPPPTPTFPDVDYPGEPDPCTMPELQQPGS